MVEKPVLDGHGFDFELSKRNAHLQTKGVQGRAPTKTGTTICGMMFKVQPIPCYVFRSKDMKQFADLHASPAAC